MYKKWTALFLLTAVVLGVLFASIMSRSQINSSTKLAIMCSTRLRTIDFAKDTWARVNNKGTNDPAPTLHDLEPFLGHLPECPCGGLYIPGRLDVPARCSLSPAEHTNARQKKHEAKRNNQDGKL